MSRRRFELKVGALVLSGFAMGLLAGRALSPLWELKMDEVGAAWAQAILSAAAILAAALIPGWHEKKRIRKRVDVLIGLISRAEDEARELSRDVLRAAGRHMISDEPAQWDRTEQQFQTIPQHDMPDPRIQWAIADSYRAVSQVRNNFAKFITPGYVITNFDYLSVKEQADVLEQCYEDAVRYKPKW